MPTREPRRARPDNGLFQRVLTGEATRPRRSKGDKPVSLQIGVRAQREAGGSARSPGGAPSVDRGGKGMFQRVLSGDPKGIDRWGTGPRFVLVCLAAGAVLAAVFGRAQPPPDGRKAAMERVAALVNPPLRELAPMHERLKATGGGETVLLGPRRAACVEAAPRVEALARVTLPPEDHGKPVASAEALRLAAEGFLEGISACRQGSDAGMPESKTLPACVLGCIRGWSSLAAAAQKLHADAAWVGVAIEPLAAPAATNP